MAKKPLVYKILEKENLLFFIAFFVFVSAVTYAFVDLKISTDHALVGMVFLIWGLGVHAFKNL